MKAGTQQGHAASIRPLDGLDLLASDLPTELLAPPAAPLSGTAALVLDRPV